MRTSASFVGPAPQVVRKIAMAFTKVSVLHTKDGSRALERGGAVLGGRSIRFGDSINTDVIIPGRYLVSIDPSELAEHAFEPLGPEVQAALRDAKVIVAGKNFGCGSAREQAASCLVGLGIEVVIARSFARVFYRNAINTGLPAIALGGAVDAIDEGAQVLVELERGEVHAGAKTLLFPPFPESLRRILESGGLIPYLARHVVGAAST